MDIKHKHVYGLVKIYGQSEYLSYDVGGIAATVQAIVRDLYTSKTQHRGDIEIILSLTPRKPEQDMTPDEKRLKEIIAGLNPEAIQDASPFDEAVLKDDKLREYYALAHKMNLNRYTVQQLKDLHTLVFTNYGESKFWDNELHLARVAVAEYIQMHETPLKYN